MSDDLNLAALTDFSRLRSEANWEYSLRNYIENCGSFDLAVAFAEVFWPHFVERRGCIIRADGFTDANFEDWWNRTNGDCIRIEQHLNVLHVADLIPSTMPPVSGEIVDYLGRTIADMWAKRVAGLYPTRRFDVWFDSGNRASSVYLHQSTN